MVNETFTEAFGYTPWGLRMEDIQGEVDELRSAHGIRNSREEAGDLAASVIQLLNEAGWDLLELLQENKEKIQRRRNQYLSLGRKVKVAILGGAFDPITTGHIKSAQFVLNASGIFDEVRIMPCFRHMDGKEMVSAEHRLAMAEIAAKADRRIKIWDYEIAHELAGDTFHFVQRLIMEDFAKDQFDFSMIIGQDNANRAIKWLGFEYAQQMMRFIVIPRKGVEQQLGVDWYLKRPHVLMNLETDIPEISSTQVRQWLKEGSEEAAKYLDPGVLAYIKDHDLYQ